MPAQCMPFGLRGVGFAWYDAFLLELPLGRVSFELLSLAEQ